jgi:DNA-binding response OmpR family regulator
VPPTVLCIDDHEGTLQTLSLLLQFAGYNCLLAATAEVALKLFMESTVDLVIVDQGLPELPGDQLAQQLKQLREVRVLMLTGNTLLEEAPPSVDVLLHKPYPPEEFLQTVAALTSKSKFAAAS